MRLYELVYILDPALDEGAVTKKLDSFHELVTADGGEVSAVDHWGIRQLAYPIKRQSTGYYVVAQFTASPPALPELERLLKLDDEVMRYLLVLNEGEPTTGESEFAERPPRDREREDEDDDDEDDDEIRDERDLDDDDDPSNSPPEFSGSRGRRRRMEGPQVLNLNFKDVSTLSHYVTEQGKILPKRTTKVSAAFQRQLGTAVKRARFLALLPYMDRHQG